MRQISLIRHYIIYLLGTMLVNASGFFLIPIYTRYLAAYEYGILEVINVSVEISSIIFSAGIGMACLSLYSKEQEIDMKNKITSTATLDMLLLASIGTLLFFLVSNRLNDYFFKGEGNLSLLRIAGLIMLSQLSLSVPMFFIQARMKSTLYVSIAALQTFISLGINVFLVVFLRMGVKGILIGNLVTFLSFATGLTAYTLFTTGIHHDSTVSRRLLSFGLPMIPGGLFQFMLHSADRFFIQKLLDGTSLGLYAVNYKMGTLVALFVLGPFLKIWGPYMFKLDRETAKDEAIGKYFLYLVTAYCVIALPIALFAKEIVVLVTGPNYWAGYKIVPLVLLAYLFWTTAAFFDSGIYITERTIYKPIIMGTAAGLIFVLYWTMIPAYGLIGGGYATAICFGVFSLMTYIVSMKIYPIHYPMMKFGYILGIGIAFFYIGSNVPEQKIVLNIAVRTLLVFCYPLLLIVIGAIDRKDIRAIQAYTCNLKQKLTHVAGQVE